MNQKIDNQAGRDGWTEGVLDGVINSNSNTDSENNHPLRDDFYR